MRKAPQRDSAELKLEDLDLFAGTARRLDLSTAWQGKPHTQRDSCYGASNPTPTQMVRVPAVLSTPEEIKADIRSPLGDLVAIDPHGPPDRIDQVARELDDSGGLCADL